MLETKSVKKMFCTFTSKDNRFSKCFLSCEESVDIQFKRWQRKLNKSIHACFWKVRLKEKEPSKIDILINEKQGLLKKKTKSDDADGEKIEDIN